MNTLTQLTGLSVDATGTQQMVDALLTTSGNLESVSDLPATILSTIWSVNNNTMFYAVVFLRLLVIIWVIKDSNYRSHNTGFVILSLLLVTLWTPLLGLPIYLAIRPLGYKYERSYWKNIMTQEGMEENSQQENQELYEVKMIENKISDTDEDHLAQLKKHATVSKRRVTRATKKKTDTVSPKTSPKTSSTPQRRSTPTRKATK